ncbi:MAG: hypothetical protein JWO08_1478 [Verrucomicrobiaceae bacterium]|nr:hypothetical protein [Verrucomicrobiaceae bacterium]
MTSLITLPTFVCLGTSICMWLNPVSALAGTDKVEPPLPGILFAAPPPKRIMAHGSLAPEQVWAEQRKLMGPCRIIPGELVTYSYAWDSSIVSKDDPNKRGSTAAIKGLPLRFLEGDEALKGEVQLISSGQAITITRTTAAGAPPGNLFSLYKPASIIGLSKTTIANRLGVPTQNDGFPSRYVREFDPKLNSWHYLSTLIEKVDKDSTGNRSAGTRKFVLWNFILIFENDLVTMIQQGPTGFTR